MQLVRGSAYNVIDEIESKISGYATIMLIGNLAGRAGAGPKGSTTVLMFTEKFSYVSDIFELDFGHLLAEAWRSARHY